MKTKIFGWLLLTLLGMCLPPGGRAGTTYYTFQLVSGGAYASDVSRNCGIASFYRNGANFYEEGGCCLNCGRGYNVAAINLSTGNLLTAVRNFDTWGSSTADDEMKEFLDSLPNGTLIMIAVADEASSQTGEELKVTLEGLGSTQIRNYNFRDGFGLIAVKGEGVARAEGLDSSRAVRLDITIPVTVVDGPPSPPTQLVVTPHCTSVDISWQAPTNIGSLGNGYQLYRNGAPISSEPFQFTDYIRETGDYCYSVTAVGLDGRTSDPVAACVHVDFQSIAQSSTLVAWGENDSCQLALPAISGNIVAIATGDWHSLALHADGTVMAWGGNHAGQGAVPPLSQVIAIAAGSSHNLALRANGRVRAWGSNGYGQTDVPVTLSNVVSIAAAPNHSLALDINGKVSAWGYNYDGQCDVPAELSNVVAIAGGLYHSLALTASGQVVGWGDDDYGQISVPAGLSNVVSIACGTRYSLALQSDGTIVGWGSGYDASLGNLHNIKSMAVGGWHAMFLRFDGTVLSLGDFWIPISPYLRQAVPPVGLGSVSAIAAGDSHSLAITGPSEPITFLSSPKITALPANQLGIYGSNVTFSVQAFGTPPFKYRWLKGDVFIPGATNSTLTLGPLQFADSGDYRVVVTGAYGFVTSQPSSLEVVCASVFSSSSILVSSAGTEGTVSIAANPSSCEWSVINTNDWIQIIHGSGTGDGTIHFVIAPNPNGVPRSGFLTLPGQRLGITQTADFAPATVMGRKFAITITQSTGALPSSENYLFLTSAMTNAYSLRDSDETNSGSFLYQKTAANSATIVANGATITLAFQTPISGIFTLIEDDGSQVGSFVMTPTAPDFNGDLRADFLVQRTDRMLAARQMDGTNLIRSVILRDRPAADGWSAIGSGDFDGDGKADVLLQHATRQFAAWIMDGTNFIRSVFVRPGRPAADGWRGVNFADYDGNGSSDILMQHTTGKLAVWYFNGTNFHRVEAINNNDRPPAAGWRAVGSADIFGDGSLDIVMQHSDRRILVWNLVGGKVHIPYLLREGKPAAAGFSLVGCGDFNDDGRTDLLFRHLDGRLLVWLMNGATFNHAAFMGSLNPNWKISSPN